MSASNLTMPVFPTPGTNSKELILQKFYEKYKTGKEGNSSATWMNPSCTEIYLKIYSIGCASRFLSLIEVFGKEI